MNCYFSHRAWTEEAQLRIFGKVSTDRPPSRPLDPWLTVECLAARALIREIDRMLKERIGRQRHRQERTLNFDLLMANILCAHLQKRGTPVSFYRSPKGYAGRTVYRPDFVSAKALRRLVDELETAGLVEQQKGYRDLAEGEGSLSLVWPTAEFRELIDRYEISASRLPRSGARPLLELRTKKTASGKWQLVEYDPTRSVHQAITRIAGQWNFYAKYRRFDLDTSTPPEGTDTLDPPVDFGDIELRRIFNDVDPDNPHLLNRGGRFYGGWWQTIPREWRRCITIDGEFTCEIDFRGMHPRMIYHLHRLQFEGDPYEIQS